MTSYELRISYWSSDVCSSDLAAAWAPPPAPPLAIPAGVRGPAVPPVRSRRRGGSSWGEALLFKVIGKTHQSKVARSEPGHVLLETASENVGWVGLIHPADEEAKTRGRKVQPSPRASIIQQEGRRRAYDPPQY